MLITVKVHEAIAKIGMCELDELKIQVRIDMKQTMIIQMKTAGHSICSINYQTSGINISEMKYRISQYLFFT